MQSKPHDKLTNDNTIVVIRSQGERTTELCKYLVEAQFDDVHLIHISPFTKAIKYCYELGINSNKDFLLTIDADVLITPDFKEIFYMCSGWQTLGHMLCKFGGYRLGGVRVHRNRRLSGIINQVRDVLRPEADLFARNPNNLIIPNITGFHDYYQSNKDLYRKGSNYLNKFKDTFLIYDEWFNKSENDYQMLCDGIKGVEKDFEEKLEINIKQFIETEYPVLLNLYETKKKELNLCQILQFHHLLLIRKN